MVNGSSFALALQTLRAGVAELAEAYLETIPGLLHFWAWLDRQSADAANGCAAGHLKQVCGLRRSTTTNSYERSGPRQRRRGARVADLRGRSQSYGLNRKF